MDRGMDGGIDRDGGGAADPAAPRSHNERLILSLLLREGALPAAELARRTELSKPTVSLILRGFEEDGLIRRRDPLRGKIGKPSIPMELDPDGAFSIGLKIGRRSSDLLLLDLAGGLRAQLHATYDYPRPEAVFDFLRDGIDRLLEHVPQAAQARICGIGIGAPFELWKWNDLPGRAAEEFSSWKDVDFAAEVAAFSALPVHVVNDATAACHAERLYGRGDAIANYAYFYVGSFIGGGVVLNGAVFEGARGNAGALGSMRTTGPLGEAQQLVDVASLHLLEARLVEAGIDPSEIWRHPQDWSGLSRHVEAWIGQTAQELAKASLSICSVIDFEAIVIDGAFPPQVRDALVERTRRYLVNQDKRGLIEPRIEAGSIGRNARAIGAASSPIFAQYLLSTTTGLARQ